jgi:pimeloyl-ACP methyl ester carboxylesterase
MRSTITAAGREVHLAGEGECTIVMVHGWPDTHALWARQVDFFSDRYRCATFTLPGFARGDRTDYSLDDIVACIAAVVGAVSHDRPVILLLHDWGCVFGYEYAMRYPQRVRQLVGLDVGEATSEEFVDSLSLFSRLLVFAYQFTLAVSFVCPRPVGDALARLVARGLQARSDFSHIHAGMSMPYAMRWFGRNGGLDNLLPVEPSFPMFYAYAEQKPLMFHSPQWLARLQQNPANRVEAFDCGHWIMVDKAESLNRSIGDWLEQSGQSIDRSSSQGS